MTKFHAFPTGQDLSCSMFDGVLSRFALLNVFIVGLCIFTELHQVADAEEVSGAATKTLSKDTQADSAATYEPTEKDFQSWIRELGSSSVDIRESATDRLYRAGSAALPF